MKTIRVLRYITLAMLLCTLAIGWWAFGSLPKDDEYWPLGPFEFQSSTGSKVTNQDLSGKISIIGCFFTCCTTQCPALSGSMARLQSELKELNDLRLISLTVDAEHDTPQKLAAYAQTFGADPQRWFFLTGEQATIEKFITTQLRQGLEKNHSPSADTGDKYMHSERLIVVDRAGQIRGFFNGIDPTEVDKLRKFVKRLHG